MLCGIAPAQQVAIRFESLAPGVLEERLKLATPKQELRFSRLKELLAAAGCGDGVLVEQKVPSSKAPNLICRVEGTQPGRILIGAHFDSAGGDGVVDNWSGAVILPSLFEVLKGNTPRHTVEVIGFAAEEKGLLGSKAYLKALTKEERAGILAVITLDSLGLGPIKLWPNSSDPKLMVAARGLARAMKFELQGVNVDSVGTTDSMTFHEAGIPVLSLHSVASMADFERINSKRDVWKEIRWEDYYASYRFVGALVQMLDQGF